MQARDMCVWVSGRGGGEGRGRGTGEGILAADSLALANASSSPFGGFLLLESLINDLVACRAMYLQSIPPDG